MRSMSRFAAVAAVVALTAFAPGSVRAADDARGKEIYQLCAQCHGPAGEGNQLALAPAIAGLGDWYIKAQLQNFKSGARGMHPEDTAGLRMYPMSQTLKTDADIEAIAAYVAAMPPAFSPGPPREIYWSRRDAIRFRHPGTSTRLVCIVAGCMRALELGG